MKTRINYILTAAFLFAGASAFGNIEVIDSLGEPQKWSDATTWVEETKPTLATKSSFKAKTPHSSLTAIPPQ